MRPLENIRVLDLTHVLAGPFGAYQLAVLGADVIKIEPPDRPDMTRVEGVFDEWNDKLYGTYFMSQNAGKRGITLNLKTQDGRAIMTELIKSADVLLQNYAGDALEDLGFGYDASAAINPQLIYCSLTGFGRTGPKANHPAYDIVIQAFSGLMSANGTPDTGPIRVGPPMVDYGTGTQAALSIAAALFQRSQTGKGQRIDVAMLDSAMMLMSAMVTDTLATGQPPGQHGNVHPDYAGYRTFDTRDGLLMIGAWTNEQFARLLDALGEPERAAQIRKTPRSKVRETRQQDTDLMAKHLRTKTADEWEVILNDAHVPAARVRTLDEAVTHDQIKSRAVIQDVDMAAGPSATARFPVAGYAYAHGSPGLDRPPPQVGEHTEEVLMELGFGADEIAAFRRESVI